MCHAYPFVELSFLGILWPAPKASPFSKGLLSCHARLFGVMSGGS